MLTRDQPAHVGVPPLGDVNPAHLLLADAAPPSTDPLPMLGGARRWVMHDDLGWLPHIATKRGVGELRNERRARRIRTDKACPASDIDPYVGEHQRDNTVRVASDDGSVGARTLCVNRGRAHNEAVLLLGRGGLEARANLEQLRAVIVILFDDILEQLHDRNVVFDAHRLTA